jgi:hypothetical protein
MSCIPDTNALGRYWDPVSVVLSEDSMLCVQAVNKQGVDNRVQCSRLTMIIQLRIRCRIERIECRRNAAHEHKVRDPCFLRSAQNVQCTFDSIL